MRNGAKPTGGGKYQWGSGFDKWGFSLYISVLGGTNYECKTGGTEEEKGKRASRLTKKKKRRRGTCK
jgi:hypothetical protein